MKKQLPTLIAFTLSLGIVLGAQYTVGKVGMSKGWAFVLGMWSTVIADSLIIAAHSIAQRQEPPDELE